MDLRQNAAAIVPQISRGQRFNLKYRGKPAGRLEPIETAAKLKPGRDRFYSLAELATTNGEPMSNEARDRDIYGA